MIRCAECGTANPDNSAFCGECGKTLAAQTTVAEDDHGLVDVWLIDAGPRKVSVIATVRDVLGLGLKDAKDLVEAAPAALATGVDAIRGRELETSFSECGASVERRRHSG